MKIIKSILIHEDIDIPLQKIAAYWKGRGMKFVECSETYLKGKRGSLLGNLTSFDMKHIISKVEIRKEAQEIKCELSVNTIFQYMTKINKRFFQLELENFERYLLFDELNEEAWQTLTKVSKDESIVALLIAVLIGIVITIVIPILL